MRLYELIESFLFESEIDITALQNKEKVALANSCHHCKSNRTRKNGHQYVV